MYKNVYLCKKNKLIMKYTILILFSLLPLISFSQGRSEQDSVINTAINSYISTSGSNLILYQGSEQIKYPLNYQNNPYYKELTYVSGDLWYAGKYYPAVKLRFDTYRQELVVQTSEPQYNIIVNTARFDSAMIHGSKLLYFPESELKGSLQGYCLIKYKAKVTLIEQAVSVLNEFTEDRTIKYKFDDKSRFYIEKEGTLFPIKNIRSLLTCFPGDAPKIKSFIRTNKLNFRKNPEATLVEILKNSGIE